MGYRYLTIGSNPSSFAITTNKKVNTQNGYYMTDSVFAYGDIPSYSLFSGIGNWNDTTPLVASSSTPPQECAHKRECKYNNRYVLQRYRHSFRITGDQSWQPVYPTEFGPIRKQSPLSIQEGQYFFPAVSPSIKLFEEPGKWYFISFPFDVYPPGIDLHFEQKDATPNDGGNYFYVQSYNGDKRASSNQSAGNWEVVPIRPDNVPLFEKTKVT